MSDDTWKLEDVRTDAFPNPSMNPVRDLAHRLEHVEKSLEDAEALVEKFSDERTHLRTEALPNAFKMLGLTQLSFGDGKTLALVNVIKAKLPADPVKREATLARLEAEGHGGVIKDQIVLKFDKSKPHLKEEVLEALRRFDNELRAEVVRDVHHMTYGALIAELLNSGREIPDDLHGVYVGELVKFR